MTHRAFQILNNPEKSTLKKIRRAYLNYIQFQVDMGPITAQRVMLRLLNMGLIERCIEDGETYFTCTPEGLRHVAECERLDSEKLNLAPPRTHEFMNQTYTPPKPGYVRNAGNKHIPSRGF